MTCVLLKLSMDCIWTYVEYMYGWLWSYMLMLTCIMSLILVKWRFYQNDMKAYISCKCPFCIFSCMVIILSTFCVLTHILHIFTISVGFGKWSLLASLKCWIAFLQDLVCPHGFEDKTFKFFCSCNRLNRLLLIVKGRVPTYVLWLCLRWPCET